MQGTGSSVWCQINKPHDNNHKDNFLHRDLKVHMLPLHVWMKKCSFTLIACLIYNSDPI